MATRVARQTPAGARPNRRREAVLFDKDVAGWPLEGVGDHVPREMTVRNDPFRQNPAYRPGNSHFPTINCLLVALSLGGCHVPVPRQPVTTVALPPVAPPASQPTAWHVPVDLRSREYTITQRARIVTTTDSSSSDDSLAIRVAATVRRTPDGGAAGLVRSADIRSLGQATHPLPGQAFPFAFLAGPYSAGVAPRAVALPPVADPCSSPTDAALLPVQDILFSAPDSLYLGRKWKDSTSTTMCRGGVMLTLAISRTFLVGGTEVREHGTVVFIDRTSQVVLSASAVRGGDTTQVDGSGGSSMRLVVDLAAGALLSADGTSQLQVEIRSATQRQHALQTTVIEVRGAETR